VRESIYKMILENADEVSFHSFPIFFTIFFFFFFVFILMCNVQVVLETEITNKGALALYETLGFIRDKRLHKYYLNGGDAFRLVLPLTPQFLAPALE
jgi:hypothetical protein